MTDFLNFVVFITLSLQLALAGDDCPALGMLSEYCSCTEYQMPLPNPLAVPDIYVTPALNTSSISSPNQSLKNLFQKLRAVTTAPQIRNPKFYTVVECNMTDTGRPSILQDLASKLHRKWIDKLYIAQLPLEMERRLVRLPSKWLQNFRIIQFQIENSVLSGDFIWSGEPFSGQTHSMVWLAATGCSLTGALTYDTLGTVNLKGLEDLQRLEGIDFSTNHLVSVENTSFTHIHRKLHTVVLARNVIQKVRSGAFHNIPKLRHLDLSQNLLENISRNVFSTEPNCLRHIDLSWNRFQALPKDLFDKMSALRYVDFSNNFLHSLPQEPWKIIWGRLVHIDVSNNFLECNCDLLWLVNPGDKRNLTQNVTGQCGRTLPSVYVKHFNLDILRRDHIACENETDFKIDDEY